MPTTHTALDYHIVFSTKNRKPLLLDEHRDEIHRFIAGWIRNTGAFAARVGGVADHVHIAAGLKPTHCVADFLRQLKRDSSAWIHDHLRIRSFNWQVGYGAFTFSRKRIDKVIGYIDSQPEHHRVRTFEEEYREFLEAYGIEFDERFLW